MFIYKEWGHLLTAAGQVLLLGPLVQSERAHELLPLRQLALHDHTTVGLHALNNRRKDESVAVGLEGGLEHDQALMLGDADLL